MSVEGSTTTYYAWDGGMTLAEYSPHNGNQLKWQKSFIYLGGRLLATESGAGTYQYHHPDRLGTRLITDSSGGIISEQIHLPYGTALTGESVSYASSANPSKKRFTSYERSDSTKLDHAVNRQYHAGLGRFTQVDPIGMSAASLGDPQSLNLYAYCGNDPINHTDPDGLFFKKLFKAIGQILSNKWVRLAIGIALAILSTGSSAFIIHNFALKVSSLGIGVVQTTTITAAGWAAIGLSAALAVGSAVNAYNGGDDEPINVGDLGSVTITGTAIPVGPIFRALARVLPTIGSWFVRFGKWGWGGIKKAGGWTWGKAKDGGRWVGNKANQGWQRTKRWWSGQKNIDKVDVDDVLNNQNNFDHVFASKHKLSQLGTEEEALKNISKAVLEADRKGWIAPNTAGVFEDAIVIVNGHSVFVRGRVIQGVLKISIIFVP
jgi:RHS repeat-associated protein